MKVLPKLNLRRLAATMTASSHQLAMREGREARAAREPSAVEPAGERSPSAASVTGAAAPRPASSETGAVPRSTWTTQASVSPSVRRSVHASGLWRTAKAGLYEDTLRATAPELHAYLAVLVRGHERARRAFEMLEEALANGHGRTVATPPGARPRLFQLARRVVLLDDVLEEPKLGVEHAPWDAAPPGRPAAYGSVLDLARRMLSETELEMLLLSEAFGLAEAEIAFVLDDDAGDVGKRVEAAKAFVALQLDDEPAARGFTADEVLRDALRILPAPEGGRAAGAVPLALPPGTVIAGRYELEATVGGGAFGHVYRARDRRVHTHVVALKLAHKPSLTEAAKEGALAELSRIASAFHPSLVQLKEYGWHDERLWFAMPFYDGETLADRVERRPFSPAEAARVLAPIAGALAALHAAGIRHQDVKPENILLAKLGDADPLPILLDLGVAARADDLAVAGTPMFFAPEVAQRVVAPDDEVAITDRADVFALAMTFVHCVAPPPADEPEFESFMRERAAAAPALPPSRELAALRAPLGRWLATSAEARPSAAELAVELSRMGGLAARTGRRASTGLVLALAACAALVAALASWLLASRAPAAAVTPPSFTTAAELAAMRERVEAAEQRASFLEERLDACE